MTGMTDISRHGGDKRNRDGLGIQVKDDALIDPALLGETAEYSMQTENLVDDSDDDGYELGDAGPGMATKVVQAGFQLLFFPLILASKAMISLKHLPWLFGQILAGVKNGPTTLKRLGTFFLSIFSPNSRLGKVLIVIGTVTGVIWLARRLRASGFRHQVSDQTETSDTQAQIPKPVPSPKPEAQNLKSEARCPMPEPEEPKSRRRIGFGQLSTIASAFKRSEPVTSPDAASPNNEDRYDFLETSGNRWSVRKSILFAAFCLMLLIGGVTVARQVMHKNDEVAQNSPDGEVNQDGDTDQEEGTQPPEPTFPMFGAYPGNSGTNGLAPQNYFPPTAGTGSGVPNDRLFDQSNNANAQLWEQVSSMPAMHNGAGDATPSGFVEYFASSGQSGSIPVDIIDPDEATIDNPQIVANDRQRPFGVDATDYVNNSDVRLTIPQVPTQEFSSNINDLPDSFDAMSVLQPQPGLVAAIPAASYASAGANQNPLAIIQPEQSFTALTPSPRTQQDRSTPTPLQDNSPALADLSRTLPNNTPGNIALSDLTPPTSTATGSGLMTLTQMNSTNMNSASTMNEINERNTWAAMPSESPIPQPMTSLVPQPMPQPMTSPGTQAGTGSGIVPNESPLQASSSHPRPEPLVAAIGPAIPDTAPSLMNPAPSLINIEAPAIPATSPLEALSQRSISAPQAHIPVPSAQTIAQLTPSVQPLNTQPVNPQPVAAQPVGAQAIHAPEMFSNAAQDYTGGIASYGIVSPSQHIAAMPMISSDTQAGFPSLDLPATTSAPAYSQLPAFQIAPAQPSVPGPAIAAQWTSGGQNSMAAFPPDSAPELRPGTTYVVQPGDSIYKIAKQELGSVRRYREIYDLNRDRLPIGQDTLTVGIELLLPAER